MATAQAQGAFGDITRAQSGLLPALSPRDRASAALRELTTLLPVLEQGIAPDPSRPALSFSPARPAASSRPPWSPRIAYALFTVAGAIEDARGYDDNGNENENENENDSALAVMLECALRGARVALGLDEAWRPLPRLPRATPPLCPFSCRLPSLRMQPLAGIVRCVTPRCRDTRGSRPRAVMQPVWAHDGSGWQARLIWDDGTRGLPAPEADETC